MNKANEKLTVIIPAYEPPKEFVDYAQKVSAMAKALIVVNDGSGKEYDETFRAIAALPGVVYLSYEENHGKGYALKTALAHAVAHLPADDILVTADCDGQHKTKDVLRVFHSVEQHPTSLVLGSRNFNLPNVPKRSRAGNAYTRGLFRFFYSLNVYDTQTGLRGFSVALAQELTDVRGDRFEYEMGVLIHAQKNAIPILETPIDTVYPEEAKDHVSHFKTISDSARVLKVLLRNLSFYILSSTISAVVDVLFFFLISAVLLDEVTAINTLIATIAARVISSVPNFLFNYKYVFGGVKKRSFVRYYILWFFQLGASYGLVYLFGNLLGLPRTPTKAVGDFLLALVSYHIQHRWVFRHHKINRGFYSTLLVYSRAIARTFSHTYRCNVMPVDEGALYVCRHMNLHGAYTCLKWMKFHVHPMVLSPFFTQKECYRQFADYTFSVRAGKRKKKINLKAFLCSLFVPIAVRGVRAIPVYRDSIKCVKTFKSSLSCLEKKESILVFPDIDYTGQGKGVSEIYDGFLYLGELYKKRTGKSLKFIPLVIDDRYRIIREGDPITVDDFKAEKESAATYLRDAIHGLTEQ